MSVSVVTAPAADPVTVDEVKLHSRISGTDEDAMLAIYIKAATEYAENVKGGSIVQRTLELRLDAFPTGDSVIVLPRGPVQSVDWVKYVDTSGNLVTMQASDYVLDARGELAQLLPAYGKVWPAPRATIDAVRVQYVAGWQTAAVPSSIRLYILALVGAMYENRELVAEKAAKAQSFLEGLLDRYWEPSF